jgi:hypothetical protein
MWEALGSTSSNKTTKTAAAKKQNKIKRME